MNRLEDAIKSQSDRLIAQFSGRVTRPRTRAALAGPDRHRPADHRPSRSALTTNADS